MPTRGSSSLGAIDRRALHYFLTLARRGSLSAAAHDLGLSQPSVSEIISRLEQRLGVKLLRRGPRGVSLTAAGRLLADEGGQIMRQLHALAENVQSMGSRPTGFVSFAMPSSMGSRLAVPLAETVHLTMPGVQLHMTEAMSGVILDKLESEEIHLGCVLGPPDPAIFVSQPMFTEEMFLITAPDNWDDRIGADGIAENPISAEQLARLPLVLPRNSWGARRLIERNLAQVGQKLNVIMEIDALPHLMQVAARASAYTLLPQIAVVEEVAQGRLAMVRIGDVRMDRTAYLVRKRDRTPSRAMGVVQTLLGQILQEVVTRHGLSLVCLPINPDL